MLPNIRVMCLLLMCCGVSMGNVRRFNWKTEVEVGNKSSDACCSRGPPVPVQQLTIIGDSVDNWFSEGATSNNVQNLCVEDIFPNNEDNVLVTLNGRISDKFNTFYDEVKFGEMSVTQCCTDRLNLLSCFSCANEIKELRPVLNQSHRIDLLKSYLDLKMKKLSWG